MLCYCSLRTHNMLNHRTKARRWRPGQCTSIPTADAHARVIVAQPSQISQTTDDEAIGKRRHPPAKRTIVRKSFHETPRARPVHNRDAAPLCCDTWAPHSQHPSGPWRTPPPPSSRTWPLAPMWPPLARAATGALPADPAAKHESSRVGICHAPPRYVYSVEH